MACGVVTRRGCRSDRRSTRPSSPAASPRTRVAPPPAVAAVKGGVGCPAPPSPFHLCKYASVRRTRHALQTGRRTRSVSQYLGGTACSLLSFPWGCRARRRFVRLRARWPPRAPTPRRVPPCFASSPPRNSSATLSAPSYSVVWHCRWITSVMSTCTCALPQTLPIADTFQSCSTAPPRAATVVTFTSRAPYPE